MTLDEQLRAEIDALRDAHKQLLEAIREVFEVTEATLRQESTYAAAVVDINRLTKTLLRKVGK